MGSKNFTEQVVLGEIIAQHLEKELGISVERKLNLGGTLLAHEALKSGAIDIYPEYTGTALTAVLKQTPGSDASAVFDQVRREYAERWGLLWLKPLGFNNSFAMVVSTDVKSNTLTEAVTEKLWRLGVGYEFQQRADGLAGLLKAYPLRLRDAPISMDLGLLYSALQGGKVDMVAANSTDGLLSVLRVKVLTDDKRYFPPYECSILVRDAAASKNPSLVAVLRQLSGKFDDTKMRRLNYAVDGQHRSVNEVASEALRQIELGN
ncbi:MAG TPA: glycine betaine ABC transporter substrate-binding protein [Bryobacteraceae bacterium]|nr:glycine betaine ABC transporter substrate-binding protein [Bryobacteraceae bacterium]